MIGAALLLGGVVVMAMAVATDSWRCVAAALVMASVGWLLLP